MKTFKEFINESFDKPAKWKLISSNKSSRIYSWKIKEYEYELVAENFGSKKEDNIWVIQFTLKNSLSGEFSFDVTGTGNEIAVFATVIDIIINDVMPNIKAEKIFFSAEKGEDEDASSRSKLYARLVKKYIPKGWKVIEKSFNTAINFTLIKGK